MKRLALVGASLVLVGGMATACGSAPEDASKDDFCKAMEGMSKADDKDSFNDALDKLKDTGTPEEIDGDARKGFEVIVDKAEWDQDDPDLSKDEEKEVEAFTAKYTELCMSLDAPTGTESDSDSGSDSGTESDAPTDVPTDVPTELPSDLQSQLDDLDLEDLESQLEDLPTEVPSE